MDVCIMHIYACIHLTGKVFPMKINTQKIANDNICVYPYRTDTLLSIYTEDVRYDCKSLRRSLHTYYMQNIFFYAVHT